MCGAETGVLLLALPAAYTLAGLAVRMAVAAFAKRELRRWYVELNHERTLQALLARLGALRQQRARLHVRLVMGQALPLLATRGFGALPNTSTNNFRAHFPAVRTVGEARVLVGRPRGASPF